MNFWLMKTEPEKFSWDDLKASPDQTTYWEGVRNYQARNFMRDDMKLGDLVLFYHSRVQPQAIAGVAEVVREAYPDHYSWEPGHAYFDPKSSPDNVRWIMVDIKRVQDIEPVITLEEVKSTPVLSEMRLVQRGSRLSVQPVLEQEFKNVLKLRGLSFADLKR